MILDFRSLENGTLIEADVCIIGAGAAGITMAREFVGSGVRVCLAESGGLEFEPDVQDLYAGSDIGYPYAKLDIPRLRYFGGTTNHWVGYCAPLAWIDFQSRDWVPHSGWPIERSDLDPFYERAQPICQLGKYAYGKEIWEELAQKPHDFDPAEIELCFWQHSPPTLFGEIYRDELERSRNVHVLLHGNAVDFQTNESASLVQHVELRMLDGKTGRVKARFYVLACGGIENARLLLLSNGVEPAGLGNRHDLLGRFFMEHPHSEPGILATDDQAKLLEIYGHYLLDEVPFVPSFCAGQTMQEREQVLNSHAFLTTSSTNPGLLAFLQLWRSVRQGQMPDGLGEKVWLAVRDLDDVAWFAYERFTGQKPLYFSIRSEQAPNPDSRVTLGDEMDALGQRRVRLDWRFTEIDKRSVKAMITALGAEFARLGVGRVRIMDWVLDGRPDWAPDMYGGSHHIGTTRMATEPNGGVVDANCRVHYLDNLYVAGSSVFPTGGCANPTLTIVALALRLADHLKQQLS